MRVTTHTSNTAPVFENASPQPTQTPPAVDSFVARQPLHRNVVHEILTNTRVALDRVTIMTDATFLASGDLRALELATDIRVVDDALQDLQNRYNEGGLPSKTELFEVKRLLWAIEAEIEDLHLVVVASVIEEDTDYNFWDLFEAKDNHNYFTKRMLNALQDNTCETLKTLGVLEREHNNKYRITDTGIQKLKEAIVLLSEVD